jgi:hypothetical protein
MNKCPGCQRQEMHKMCPAYNTPFYMTGIPFTNNIEQLYYKLDELIKNFYLK